VVIIFEFTEDFESGTLGAQATGRLGIPYEDRPAGTTGFDRMETSGHFEYAVFTTGRNGGVGVTRGGGGTAFGLNYFELFLNGYDWDDYLPDPMTGDLTVSAWHHITDGGGNATYLLLGVQTINLDEPDDSYNFDTFALNTYYIPNPSDTNPGTFQVVYRPSDWAGPNGANNVMEEYWGEIPLDTWVKITLRYSQEGVIQATLENTAGDILVDTGEVQSVSGWTPFRSQFTVMNYNGTQYVVDDYHAIIESELAITGRPDNVRRRFVRA
jgi:hypothetical protein